MMRTATAELISNNSYTRRRTKEGQELDSVANCGKRKMKQSEVDDVHMRSEMRDEKAGASDWLSSPRSGQALL